MLATFQTTRCRPSSWQWLWTRKNISVAVIKILEVKTYFSYDTEIDHWKGGLHPMNKQTVSERLAVAGMNVAYVLTRLQKYLMFTEKYFRYGHTKYETRGPWPTTVTLDSE